MGHGVLTEALTKLAHSLHDLHLHAALNIVGFELQGLWSPVNLVGNITELTG